MAPPTQTGGRGRGRDPRDPRERSGVGKGHRGGKRILPPENAIARLTSDDEALPPLLRTAYADLWLPRHLRREHPLTLTLLKRVELLDIRLLVVPVPGAGVLSIYVEDHLYEDITGRRREFSFEAIRATQGKLHIPLYGEPRELYAMRVQYTITEARRHAVNGYDPMYLVSKAPPDSPVGYGPAIPFGFLDAFSETPTKLGDETSEPCVRQILHPDG